MLTPFDVHRVAMKTQLLIPSALRRDQVVLLRFPEGGVAAVLAE